MKKKNQKPRRGHKNGRPNPAYKLPGLDKMLADTAGNLVVTSALQGCSLDEKMFVAGMIPMVLGFIRSVSKPNLKDAVDKLFPEEVVITLGEPFVKPEGVDDVEKTT
jgi:hypothetical protein